MQQPTTAQSPAKNTTISLAWCLATLVQAREDSKLLRRYANRMENHEHPLYKKWLQAAYDLGGLDESFGKAIAEVKKAAQSKEESNPALRLAHLRALSDRLVDLITGFSHAIESHNTFCSLLPNTVEANQHKRVFETETKSLKAIKGHIEPCIALVKVHNEAMTAHHKSYPIGMPECVSNYSHAGHLEIGDGIDPRVVEFRKFERLFGKVKVDILLFLQLSTNHAQFEWWNAKAGVLETHLQAAEVALKPIKEDPVRKLNSDTFGLQEMQALEIELDRFVHQAMTWEKQSLFAERQEIKKDFDELVSFVKQCSDVVAAHNNGYLEQHHAHTKDWHLEPGTEVAKSLQVQDEYLQAVRQAAGHGMHA